MTRSISQLEARILTNPYYSEEDREAMKEVFKDAERYAWIADRDRERYVSVQVDFGPMDQATRSAKYRQHRVCWHVPEYGWVDASGDGLDEAIDAAIGNRD